MADSLAKISGTLQSLSGEELARQQGLSAAPPTPLGAQGIGASQDVAKMAGTPNQVRAMVQDTLKERLRTSDLLQESERNGARKRFTVESLQEKMNALEGLGSLGGRIPEKVKQSIVQAQTLAIPNSVNAEAVKSQLSTVLKQTVTDTEVSKAVAALQKLQSKDASVDDTFNALKTLGISVDVSTDASKLATLLAPFYNQADVNDIAKAMSEKLGAYAKVTMADLPDLYKDIVSPDTDIQDIPAILGISDDAFSKMTLSDVRAQLKAWKSRNFQDVDALRGVLDNPSYSMSEKDYARKRLAELGAVGVTSIEQKTDKLDAQIAEGDTVVVGGQAVRVSELMSDPKLKATISNALSSPEELTKLQSTDPGLATWITTNKKSLVAVQDQLREGTQTFAANQKEFSDKLGTVATTHKALLDSVIPGWDKAKNIGWTEWIGEPASGDKPATGLYKDSPTIAYALNIPDATKKGYALAALSKVSPTQAKQFSTNFLDQIAGAATSDTEAMQFMEDYQATENKDWKNEATTTAGLSLDPAGFFDENYSQADYNNVVKDIVQTMAPGFNSLQDLTARIKQLSTGGPKERSEARRLSGVLANIKGQINQRINKNTIDKLKIENKTSREKKSYGESVKFVDDTINNIVNQLSGRGNDHLKTRGTEQFAKIKSALSSLRMQAAEGSISYEEAKKKAEQLKGNMVGELAAFAFDENHRKKNPEAALNALEYLVNNNLTSSIDKNMQGNLLALFGDKDTYNQWLGRRVSQLVLANKQEEARALAKRGIAVKQAISSAAIQR